MVAQKENNYNTINVAEQAIPTSVPKHPKLNPNAEEYIPKGHTASKGEAVVLQLETQQMVNHAPPPPGYRNPCNGPVLPPTQPLQHQTCVGQNMNCGQHCPPHMLPFNNGGFRQTMVHHPVHPQQMMQQVPFYPAPVPYYGRPRTHQMPMPFHAEAQFPTMAGPPVFTRHMPCTWGQHQGQLPPPQSPPVQHQGPFSPPQSPPVQHQGQLPPAGQHQQQLSPSQSPPMQHQRQLSPPQSPFVQLQRQLPTTQSPPAQHQHQLPVRQPLPIPPQAHLPPHQPLPVQHPGQLPPHQPLPLHHQHQFVHGPPPHAQFCPPQHSHHQPPPMPPPTHHGHLQHPRHFPLPPPLLNVVPMCVTSLCSNEGDQRLAFPKQGIMQLNPIKMNTQWTSVERVGAHAVWADGELYFRYHDDEGFQIYPCAWLKGNHNKTNTFWELVDSKIKIHSNNNGSETTKTGTTKLMGGLLTGDNGEHCAYVLTDAGPIAYPVSDPQTWWLLPGEGDVEME